MFSLEWGLNIRRRKMKRSLRSKGNPLSFFFEGIRSWLSSNLCIIEEMWFIVIDAVIVVYVCMDMSL